MNTKTQWISGSIFINLVMVSIALYLFNQVDIVSDANDYFPIQEEITSMFSAILLMLFTPVITIALHPALFLPLSPARKIAWFFSTLLLFIFAAPLAVIGASGIGSIIFSLLTIVFLGIFANPLLGAIANLLMLAFLFLLTGGMLGLLLGTLQRNLITGASSKETLAQVSPIAHTWHTQVIKSGLISGFSLPLIVTLTRYIEASISPNTTMNTPLLAIIALFTLTLPLTLLTAKPAKDLHNAITTQNNEVSV